MVNGVEAITADAPRQVVHSPEQVVLELPIAGPTSRILAYAIDAVLMLAVQIGALALLFTSLPAAGWLLDLVRGAAEELSGEELVDPGLGRQGLLLFAVFLAVQLLIELFYFVFFESVARGRSPGKRALGLGVVRGDGLPVSFSASLVRNLLRSVDILPASYTTGLVTMLVSRQSQRLGDIAAGTLVIRFDRPQAAAPLPGTPPGDAPHFPFTREQLDRVGSVERRLLRQTLRRLPALPSDGAAELAQRSASALAERLGTDPVEADDADAFLRALHARLLATGTRGR